MVDETKRVCLAVVGLLISWTLGGHASLEELSIL